jgi:hypothetical protein
LSLDTDFGRAAKRRANTATAELPRKILAGLFMISVTIVESISIFSSPFLIEEFSKLLFLFCYKILKMSMDKKKAALWVAFREIL